jgi:hypothetical protein
MLRALKNPYENDLAGSTGVVGVATHQLTSMWHGMSNTNTSGEQHDMAIGLVRISGAIRTFNKGIGEESTIWSILGLLPERVSEADG